VATTGLLTDMNQPLGRMIGNAVEIDESIAALEGGGPEDLRELTLALGAELLVSTGIQSTTTAATAQLAELLDTGHARNKFQEMVAAQGGDLNATRRVATASQVLAIRDGYVRAVDAERLGEIVIRLGGGRRVMSDSIDHAVGLEMLVRIGDVVQRGQPLITVLADTEAATDVRSDLIAAITIDDGPYNAAQLIVDRFSAQDESEP
jgi:thymidine phosphorylase